MYLPKNLWPVNVRKKLQIAGATALIGALLVGCSTVAPNTSEVVETAVSIPTTVPTAMLLPTEVAATLTPFPTPLLEETVVYIPPTLTPVPAPPTAEPTAVPTIEPTSVGQYMDGDYLGASVRTDRWGNTQVIAHIEGGMLVDVEIAQYPNSKGKSSRISWAAFPALITEAVRNQDADINIVTRATDTSVAFIESLESALEEAAAGASL